MVRCTWLRLLTTPGGEGAPVLDDRNEVSRESWGSTEFAQATEVSHGPPLKKWRVLQISSSRMAAQISSVCWQRLKTWTFLPAQTPIFVTAW
jgi:hypothetical protein